MSFLTFSWSLLADIDIESEFLHFLGDFRFDLWAVWRLAFLRTYRARFSYLPATEANKVKEIPSMPALNEPVPSNWITIEDKFFLFWASQVTHAGIHQYHAPPCRMQDGVFQILIVR